MRIHTIGMIASRMVGCGLILIGLIAAITELFVHRPGPESQTFNISPPVDDQPVQIRYITTYTIMHPGYFMVAGAVLLFFSSRVSRIVLFDLEDDLEATKPVEPTGNSSFSSDPITSHTAGDSPGGSLRR